MAVMTAVTEEDLNGGTNLMGTNSCYHPTFVLRRKSGVRGRLMMKGVFYMVTFS